MKHSFVVACAMAVLLAAAPVSADPLIDGHTEIPVVEQVDYRTYYLTFEEAELALVEYQEWLAAQPKPVRPKPRPVRRAAVPVAPDHLRALISAYFAPGDVEVMLRVAWCESGYNANAKNPSSSAAGLFQHLAGWYEGRWGLTGVFDPYDPEQSVQAAAALLYGTSSGIGNWNASRSCWG